MCGTLALNLIQAAREDLQQCLDLMPPADAATGATKRDREDVEREVADMDRQLQAAAERAAARAAAAAARPQRVTNYARARVTIEEHADEAEEEEREYMGRAGQGCSSAGRNWTVSMVTDRMVL